MKNAFSRLMQNFSGKAGLILLLFGIEGVFLQFATSINSLGNSLYATSMGATDSQIGMIQMIPNLVAVAILFPLGILSDRLKSSKTVPLAALIVMAIAYFCMGTVPMLGEARMIGFFVCLAFTVGGLAVYNGMWQDFFGDVTPIEERNSVFAFRNRFMFLIGIIAPIICGILMGFFPTNDGTQLVLRLFFYITGALMLLQAFVIAKIPGGQRSPERLAEMKAKRFSPKDVTTAISDAMHNRDFLMFFLPILFFYVGWHLDWSMWYIGMTQYVHMDASTISIYNGIFSVGQLVAIGIIAKLAAKKGPDFTILTGMFGLILCPISMLVCSFLPVSISPWVFTALITICNAPQCAISLCVVQMLLKAAPERNRSLIISLYTMVITLSNSLTPFLGVQLYTALGANHFAFYFINVFTMAWRASAFLLFLWRYRHLKKQGKIEIA